MTWYSNDECGSDNLTRINNRRRGVPKVCKRSKLFIKCKKHIYDYKIELAGQDGNGREIE